MHGEICKKRELTMRNCWGGIVASRPQLPSPTPFALNQKDIVAIVVRADATAICGKADHDVHMGGTAANIAAAKDNEAGDHAGLGDMNAKEDSAGNVNVPGGKAAKAGKAEPKGHGAEKKGAGETADNKKPTIGG